MRTRLGDQAGERQLTISANGAPLPPNVVRLSRAAWQRATSNCPIPTDAVPQANTRLSKQPSHRRSYHLDCGRVGVGGRVEAQGLVAARWHRNHAALPRRCFVAEGPPLGTAIRVKDEIINRPLRTPRHSAINSDHYWLFEPIERAKADTKTAADAPPSSRMCVSHGG